MRDVSEASDASGGPSRPGNGRSPERAHHREGGGFRNPWLPREEHGFLSALRWMLVERLTTRRRPDPAPESFPRAAPSFATPRAAPDTLTVTWIGHSSFLLQVGGRNVLVDPVWSERASPVSFAGPRRWVQPGVAFGALPPIDVVLLSHDHYDHLDVATARRLAAAHPSARWLAPLGLAPWLHARGARDVAELDWWETAEAAGLTVTATPARHFSGRGLVGRNRRLWCGWVVAGGGRRIFYGGDTGFHPEFGRIGERAGPFDLVLLPIGAYDPRWFMREVHMDPEEAVRAHAEATAGPASPPPLVAMHWGTFKLTDEPLDEPPRRARDAWRRAGRRDEDLWVLRHGETREVR